MGDCKQKYPERMAKWIPANNRPCSTQFKCSGCGEIAYYVHGNRKFFNPDGMKKEVTKFCAYVYCPYCGAKMRGDKKCFTP